MYDNIISFDNRKIFIDGKQLIVALSSVIILTVYLVKKIYSFDSRRNTHKYREETDIT